MICEKCGKEFFEDWRKDKQQRKQVCRFCSKTCANTRIHKEETKEKISKSLIKSPDKICTICNKKMSKSAKGNLCKECLNNIQINRNKGELFKTRKNWQSARTTIRENANFIFFKVNKKEYKCEKCGYIKHIDVAHKKSVSSFEDTATVKEINDIGNLIGLCPNCHWEYDNNNQ